MLALAFLVVASAPFVVASAPSAHSIAPQSADWDSATSLAIEHGPDGRAYAARELLLGVEPGADRTDLFAAIEHSGARVLGEARGIGVLRIELLAAASVESRIESFERIPGVRFAERNGIGRPGQVAPPNDTGFAQQWHLRNTAQQGVIHGADIDALEAWEITTGDPSVVLAILDSGIDVTHPDFAGRVIAGYDFVDEDDDPSTGPGTFAHGSSCAGLAAANANNAFSVAGVDHACRILPIRVINEKFGTTFDLVQALNYCAAQAPDVVSMSLIDYPANMSLQLAIKAARNAGCILIASAGNGGTGDANHSWPGASPNVMSIGATTSNDSWAAPYSGTGAALDFVAPGHRVVTVWYAFDMGGEFSGTSASAPIAAGIVCLMKAKDPTLTYDRAYALLRLGAEDEVAGQDVPGRDNIFGWGRLNAWRSLACMTEIPQPEAYGVGTPTASGGSAQLSTKGTPRVSFNDFSVEMAGATPGSFARLLFGPAPATDGSSGGTPLVSGPLVVAALAQVGPGGRARFPIWVSSAMAGETRCYQAAFSDPAHGASLSNAVTVKFGP
jgi:subtilisin family serine protease